MITTIKRILPILLAVLALLPLSGCSRKRVTEAKTVEKTPAPSVGEDLPEGAVRFTSEDFMEACRTYCMEVLTAMIDSTEEAKRFAESTCEQDEELTVEDLTQEEGFPRYSFISNAARIDWVRYYDKDEDGNDAEAYSIHLNSLSDDGPVPLPEKMSLGMLPIFSDWYDRSKGQSISGDDGFAELRLDETFVDFDEDPSKALRFEWEIGYSRYASELGYPIYSDKDSYLAFRLYFITDGAEGRIVGFMATGKRVFAPETDGAGS